MKFNIIQKFIKYNLKKYSNNNLYKNLINKRVLKIIIKTFFSKNFNKLTILKIIKIK
jgi:hypothetical protein